MTYRLLSRFESLFYGKVYRHRNSTQGDYVASELFEDLYNLNNSKCFTERVNEESRIVNRKNTKTGKRQRRGDGTFGEIVPQETPINEKGYNLRRAITANIEIGIEVKILATAMIKQQDRVINDLRKQVDYFAADDANAVKIGILGVNYAPYYVGYEGDKQYPTDGSKFPHPYQQAPKARAAVESEVSHLYDEFLVLPFEATNTPPFSFKWSNPTQTNQHYGAALTRILRLYEKRFCS